MAYTKHMFPTIFEGGISQKGNSQYVHVHVSCNNGLIFFAWLVLQDEHGVAEPAVWASHEREEGDSV